MKRNKVIAIPENQFRLYLPKLYEELNSWNFPKNFTWLQKMYHFGNGDKNLELGLCKECGRRCVYSIEFSEATTDGIIYGGIRRKSFHPNVYANFFRR